MWVVAETAPYEGCYEHFGPFDSEEEAEHWAKVRGQKNRLYDYIAFELTTPQTRLEQEAEWREEARRQGR